MAIFHCERMVGRDEELTSQHLFPSRGASMKDFVLTMQETL